MRGGRGRTKDDIQYRAFNKETGMIEWPPYIYQLNLAKYIPMKFTNIHDKSGTQVFEGDIVERDGKRKVIEVGFNGSFPEDEDIEGYEVIGDIYQHPYLLS